MLTRRSYIQRYPCPAETADCQVVGSDGVTISGSMNIVPANGGLATAGPAVNATVIDNAVATVIATSRTSRVRLEAVCFRRSQLVELALLQALDTRGIQLFDRGVPVQPVEAGQGPGFEKLAAYGRLHAN